MDVISFQDSRIAGISPGYYFLQGVSIIILMPPLDDAFINIRVYHASLPFTALTTYWYAAALPIYILYIIYFIQRVVDWKKWLFT